MSVGVQQVGGQRFPIGVVGECGTQHAEAVTSVDLAPSFPPDRRRRVDESDLAQGGIVCHIEPGDASGAQGVAAGARATTRGKQRRRYLGLGGLQNGLEQILLALEVVVKRASTEPSVVEDVLD